MLVLLSCAGDPKNVRTERTSTGRVLAGYSREYTYAYLYIKSNVLCLLMLTVFVCYVCMYLVSAWTTWSTTGITESAYSLCFHLLSFLPNHPFVIKEKICFLFIPFQFSTYIIKVLAGLMHLNSKFSFFFCCAPQSSVRLHIITFPRSLKSLRYCTY